MKNMLLCLIAVVMLAACGSDDAGPPSKLGRKYGTMLIAEYDVPDEQVDRFNRQPAPRRKPHESALEATLGAGGETWHGEAVTGAPKTIPHRIVVTLRGVASHDGDATTAWFAGWRNDQGLTTSKLLTGLSKSRVKAGQPLTLTAGSEPMRLSEGKRFDPELQLIRLGNIKLDSVHVQIWSGLGSETTGTLLRPLGIFAIPIIMVVCWVMLRRGRHREARIPEWGEMSLRAKAAARSAGADAGTNRTAPKPAAAPAPAVPDDVLARIVPTIKSGMAPGAAQAARRLEGDNAPVVRPLAGDLVVMYAEDFDDRFEFVSEWRMRELGLTPDALHALAVRNLPLRAPKIQLHGQAPRYMVSCGGNFEAALLLHGRLWAALAQKLAGELMVAVPARDLLFVSSTGSPDAHEFLHGRANQELVDARYALSKKVFLRRDGRWIEYAAEPS